MKERLFRGDVSEYERSRREDFDPIAEGKRYGLSPDVSAALWEHVRREATSSDGLCDENAARARFVQLAEHVARRGGQLGPEPFHWTQIDAAVGSLPPDLLAERVLGRTTLVLADASARTRVALSGVPSWTTLVANHVASDVGSLDESRGFFRRYVNGGHAARAKLEGALAARDHYTAVIATGALTEDLTSARRNLANGLERDEGLRAELAALEGPAEQLLVKLPNMSAGGRPWQLWGPSSAEWRAAIGDDVERADGRAQTGAHLDEPRAPQRLPASLQGRMERAYGRRFDDVERHRDSAEVPAGQLAMTRGRPIHLERGAVELTAARGELVLADELAHVAQQDGRGERPGTRRELEREAAPAPGVPRTQGAMYRITALQEVLHRIGNNRRLWQEVMAAAVHPVETIAGVAPQGTASDTPATGGQALWQVAERRTAMLYRHAANAGASDVHDPAIDAALKHQGGGEQLPTDLQAEMERELGVSFASVRIHTDAVATRAAQALDANAFTVGEDIYFVAGSFAPTSRSGRKLIAHELTHVAQALRGASALTGELRVSHPSDSSEREAETFADHFDARSKAEPTDSAPRRAMAPAARGNAFAILRDPAKTPPDATAKGPNGPNAKRQPIDVLSLSEAEYEALTGQPAAALPEGELPDPKSQPRSPAGAGVGSLFTPQPNWYYRVLSSTDPKAAEILGGAGLKPVAPNPGNTFQPANSPAEMTFRHTRPGGNVPQTGTDRISTANNLESFETLLANRGTGEMVRIDVDAARRLGAQFLEHGDIMAHLGEIGRLLNEQLEAARTAGRGKNFIAKIEGRLAALERAKEYAGAFGEGHGVNAVPSGAISQVKGATLPDAVAGERALLSQLRAFRVAGRVMLVVGIGMSIAHVASAPEGQRGRVAVEEAGGWALSFGGAAVGAKLGAGAGAMLGWETGPGAVVATILGAAIGAAIGFFGGEKAVSAIADSFDIDAMIHEALISDYRKFKELNPDATPADYDRLQQAQDDFDTWGIP